MDDPLGIFDSNQQESNKNQKISTNFFCIKIIFKKNLIFKIISLKKYWNKSTGIKEIPSLALILILITKDRKLGITLFVDF